MRAEENIEGGGIRRQPRGYREIHLDRKTYPGVFGRSGHRRFENARETEYGKNDLQRFRTERTVGQGDQNEVIGLKIDGSGFRDFSWQINQRPLTCNQAGVSPDCSDTSTGNTGIFPVTGNTGDSYEVTVTAINTATGQK